VVLTVVSGVFVVPGVMLTLGRARGCVPAVLLCMLGMCLEQGGQLGGSGGAEG